MHTAQVQESQFRPGGSRTLPFFRHLPAFAPELFVLAAAAMVGYHCSRVPKAPPRPELQRSGSSSSLGSNPPKKAGAAAKQVHRAFHAGDYGAVLKVWSDVSSAPQEEPPLELPALKLVVKAMLDASPDAGLSPESVAEVACYAETLEGGPARAGAGLLQAVGNWQASHPALGGLASLRPLADAMGVGLGDHSPDEVAAACAMASCYALHGRTAEVEDLLQAGCNAKVYDEACAGYLKSHNSRGVPAELHSTWRFTTALNTLRRLHKQGGQPSSSSLTLLFETARGAQVVALFQEAKGWGPLPTGVLDVVATQAYECQNAELGQEVAKHMAGGHGASPGAYLSLVRLSLATGDGEKAAKLLGEMTDQFTVSARTCTSLFRVDTAPASSGRVEGPLPVVFLDAVLGHCRARHYFEVAGRAKADTTETANLYAAAIIAHARVPARLPIAVALDSQLSMLGLDRKRALKATSPCDIAKSDCVMLARRMLQMARAAHPPPAPPGL